MELDFSRIDSIGRPQKKEHIDDGEATKIKRVGFWKYGIFADLFNGETVRTVTVDNEIYFAGRDVAKILGYPKYNNALRTLVDEEDKRFSKMDTPRGKQNLVVINESGLYSLVLSSTLPQAEIFKRWVTSEVLPTMRRVETL